jgi:superkiller protein 3
MLSGFFVPDKKSFQQSLTKAGYGTKPLNDQMIFRIGKYSGVEVAVSGSFRMYGNTMELKVLYSNAFNGTELMSHTFSEPITNFFITGRKMIDQIVTLAGINVTQTERRLLDFTLTNSITAYGSFIKAYMENEKSGSRIEVVTGLFRKAIREDAKFWEAYYNLGIVHFNAGSYNKALQQFNTVIQALPNFDKPYFGRGLIYDKQKKYDLARKDFIKVTEFNPNDYKPFFYLGRISLREKKFKDAAEFLDKTVHINPNYAPAFFQLGNVYYDQNLYRKAIEHYKNAVKLDDQNADYHLKLGDCYYRSDIFYNALNEINASLKINPSNYLAHFLRGITVYKQAVLQELVNAFLEILSENNNKKKKTGSSSIPSKRKASIDPVAQRQVYVDMAAAFTNSIALKPNFMEATFNLALTNHEMGNPDEAEKYYLRTIQINPNLIRAHLKLAELLAEQNRKQAALEQYRRIFYIDPRFFVLHPTLGPEFQYINVLDKFRAETEKNLQQNPDSPRENLVLARLFQEKGEYGKAANLARKVLSLNPNNRTAKDILKNIEKVTN